MFNSVYYDYNKLILPQIILCLEAIADNSIKSSQSTGHLIVFISSFYIVYFYAF